MRNFPPITMGHLPLLVLEPLTPIPQNGRNNSVDPYSLFQAPVHRSRYLSPCRTMPAQWASFKSDIMSSKTGSDGKQQPDETVPNTANTAGGRYSRCIERRQWGTNCMLVRSVIPRWVAEQTHSPHCRCITSVYTHRPARPYISSRYARTMALIRDCCWCGYYRAETEGFWLVRGGDGGSSGRRWHTASPGADSTGKRGHPRS